MGRSINIIILAAVVFQIISDVTEVEAALSCSAVRASFRPCVSFLKGRAKPAPACCSGGRGLADHARMSKKDGRAIWSCITGMLARIGPCDRHRVSLLGRKCGFRNT